MPRRLVWAALVAASALSCVRHEYPEAPRWLLQPPPTRAASPPSAGAPRGADSPDAQLRSLYGAASPITVLTGSAVYYSDALAGRPTASGEIYDPSRPTAAHKELPFGTVVRVVRPSTGRDVYVRITDRGPFGDARRIIDLSGAAADVLDMRRAGVVDVRVEVLALSAR